MCLTSIGYCEQFITKICNLYIIYKIWTKNFKPGNNVNRNKMSIWRNESFVFKRFKINDVWFRERVSAQVDLLEISFQVRNQIFVAIVSGFYYCSKVLCLQCLWGSWLDQRWTWLLVYALFFLGGGGGGGGGLLPLSYILFK